MNKADQMHAEYFSDDYNRGFKDGEEHQEPSKKTLEKFDNMTEEITNIKVTLGEHGVKIENIDKNVGEIKDQTKTNAKKIDEFIDKANECYATKDKVNKLENKFWAGLVSIIGLLGTVIWFLIDFIKDKLS